MQLSSLDDPFLIHSLHSMAVFRLGAQSNKGGWKRRNHRKIGASLLSSLFDKPAMLRRPFDTFCMFLSCSTTQCNSRVSQSVEMVHSEKTQDFILLWLAYRWKINGTHLKKCFSDCNWSLIGWVKPIIIDDQLHYPSWFPTPTRIQAGL